MEETKSIHVKNFPVKLWGKVRVKALQAGITAKQAVIEALETWARKGKNNG